jgi:hypothetical protein
VHEFHLVLVPFMDGPIQGLLFFVPPFRFYYLYKYWKRMKQATLQFLSPAAPIVGIILAF